MFEKLACNKEAQEWRRASGDIRGAAKVFDL
jgi:hypothetical protein